jgi:CheY-like chemotaxis protein
MKSGHEVLNYLKNSATYRHIAVIMLTTSSSEKDVLRAYDSYVNCYITKPIDASDFMDAVTKIEDFWISIVTLPR